MSPRLRPAPSRSSFQAEVAVLLRRHEVALVVIVLLDLKVWEEGGERCGASSPVPTGSRHDPRPPSLSLSRLRQAAGDESSSGRAWQAARVAGRARCSTTMSSPPIHIVPIDCRRCQSEPHTRANDFPSLAVVPAAARLRPE
uniref:Uncharacterized protein n=1 Tax=Oryza sativa subsp. japonica TaxID=39947 RepID=Q84NN7_ORYSJ|nr:hypothetical protein [Oryza sativa Japonica Group]